MDFNDTKKSVKPIISTRDLSLKHNKTTILNRVSIDLFGCEVHALVGNHGEGKTIFCKALCGKIAIDEGLILDQHQQKCSKRQLNSIVEVVWEEPNIFQNLNIAENIVIGTSYSKWNMVYSNKNLLEKIQHWLDMNNINWSAKTPASRLSPNDQVFLSLLRALYRNPKILVLDSALAALPPESIAKAHKLVRNFLSANKSVLWITHDLDNISKFADRVSIFRNGSILLTEKIGEIERLNLLELCYAKLDNAYPEEQRQFHEMLLYFEALLEQLPLSVFILNNSGEIVFGNHLAKELFGQEGIGTRQTLSNILGDENKDILRIVDTTESFQPQTSIPVKLNGKSSRMKVGVHNIVDRGTAAGKMVIIEDVTVTENLREQITLAENLSSLGLLAAGVSHEINNSLNIIATYIAFLLGDASVEQQHEAVINISEEVNEIKRITSNLKTFSGSDNSSTEIFDCTNIINHLVSILRFESKHMKINLKTEIPTQPLKMLGNPGEIRQVLLNLVRNSFESIVSSNSKGTIIISAYKKDENHICITVEDNGTGVKHDKINEVFLPFSSSKKNNYDNQGLGLSIAYGIIKRHKGSMSIKNTMPHGCIVTIELPAK